MVLESAEHLRHIIDDILDLSKMDADRFQITTKPLILKAMVESSINICLPAAKHREIELVLQIDKKAPIQIIGDEHRLRQILLNLLSNAIKFTPTNGTITLLVTEHFRDIDDDISTLEFSVKDDDTLQKE